MESKLGSWVAGENFFDRETELVILETRVSERNHVVLSGQRRMGKTSLLRELGRRLENKSWIALFVDVENARSAEDVIAAIASATFPHRPLISRIRNGMKDWFADNVEEIDIQSFGVNVRAKLTENSWQHHGRQLLEECSTTEEPVVLVIDELPIFLKRMVNADGNANRVEEFLSWLRATTQILGRQCPTFLLSGSIGLQPLVNRLRISDRINYLDPFRLDPWDQATTVACIEKLSNEYRIALDDSVGEAIYEKLGAGIPHHVQSFFARLRDHCVQSSRNVVRVSDVEEVYRTKLLGASGQSDLVHYESRLHEALDGDAYSLAMEILAESALEGSFTQDAERSLVSHYENLTDNVAGRISEVLDVLLHDGYLEEGERGYRFCSNLLKDWWASRFRNHHIALSERNQQTQR